MKKQLLIVVAAVTTSSALVVPTVSQAQLADHEKAQTVQRTA